MRVRPFRAEDAPALAALAAACAKGETDFVLNPMWESTEELFAEFERHEIDPVEHLRVAEAPDGQVAGLAGFLRRPGSGVAGLYGPIVDRRERGRGVGGELLRATLAHGGESLGVKLVSAAIGSRNAAGYALLASLGFRPVRQHFLMRCTEKPKPPRLGIEGLGLEAAEPEDAGEILALYETCGFEPRTPEAMRAALSDGRHAHAVARHDGRIVAFTELETHWARRVWVAYVGVAGALRDRGVGSSLVAWALERQFAGEARSALLLLSPANRTALRAYEKVGFHRHRTVDVLEKGL